MPRGVPEPGTTSERSARLVPTGGTMDGVPGTAELASGNRNHGKEEKEEGNQLMVAKSCTS